nr:uncharacterized protein LOC129462947 [Symphalangus syndactylus]
MAQRQEGSCEEFNCKGSRAQARATEANAKQRFSRCQAAWRGSERPPCSPIPLSCPRSRGAAPVDLATVLLMVLGLLLSPSLPHACPMQAWKPWWRSLGQPQVPAEYVILRDSLPFYEDLGPWGSGEGADSEKAMSRGTGEPLLSQTLEDFSVRTVYDKLEDQNLHGHGPAAPGTPGQPPSPDCHPGSSHPPLLDTAEPRRMPTDKRVTLVFPGLSAGLSRTELQALGRGGDPETDPKAAARADTGQSQEPWDGHTAASQRECQQPPPEPSLYYPLQQMKFSHLNRFQFCQEYSLNPAIFGKPKPSLYGPVTSRHLEIHS